MGKCRFCGGDSGSILIHKQLKEIKPEEAFDPNPCPKCKDRFKDHKYFFSDCGHSGFIKSTALANLLSPDKYKEINKIFRMEKCFLCMKMIEEKNVIKI